MSVTPEDIATAHEQIQPYVLRTPTVAAPRLGEPLGARLWLKLENLQYTGSFKDRGSCYKLQRLTDEAPSPAGVIAASAGNHAQGVAHHAHRLGLQATIVMPWTTPFAKVERTEGHGARVVLHGESLAESYQHALEIADAEQLTFIHPYDDPDIIAGQGTVARELLEDAPSTDTLVVPIGGGGLAAGVAVWAKHVNPDVRLLGVQTEGCPSMGAALAGEPMPRPNTHTLADGIAVKTPGKLPLELLRARIDDVLLVSERDVEEAVQLLAAQQKVVAEGAGAAGYAAMLRHNQLFEGREVGVVICGGNIDRRMLSTVLMRGLQRDGKIAKLRISIHDVPGVLSKVTQLIGAAGADVVDVEHQRLFNQLPPREAELHVVMETKGAAHVEQILAQLAAAGFAAESV
ncbi:MAG: threonine ammonia-lyase [Planctomycetota bacterium]|nr:threonine ammonia-lyase [Planctomycetota bacterium]